MSSLCCLGDCSERELLGLPEDPGHLPVLDLLPRAATQMNKMLVMPLRAHLQTYMLALALTM